MTGHLRVVLGPMFAGKTERLIDAVLGAGCATRVYRPRLDVRAPGSAVVSHAGRSLPAMWCDVTLEHVLPGGLVAVDEAQFLAPPAVDAVAQLRAQGTRVVIAGLDLDYAGRPFGSMAALADLADEVHRLTARCALCRGDATRTRRKVASRDLVLCGGADAYEALCAPCWSAATEEAA